MEVEKGISPYLEYNFADAKENFMSIKEQLESIPESSRETENTDETNQSVTKKSVNTIKVPNVKLPSRDNPKYNTNKSPLTVVDGAYVLPKPYRVRYETFQNQNPKDRIEQFKPTYRNPTWKLTSSANNPNMEKHCPRQYMICTDKQNKPFTDIKNAKPIQLWGKRDTLYAPRTPGAYKNLNYVKFIPKEL